MGTTQEGGEIVTYRPGEIPATTIRSIDDSNMVVTFSPNGATIGTSMSTNSKGGEILAYTPK